MKVLYPISGIGPPSGWGTEFIQNTIFNLSKKGVQATIITPIYKHVSGNMNEWIKYVEDKHHVKIITIDAPKFINQNLMLHLFLTPLIVTLRMLKILKKEKFDIIHTFSSIPIMLIRSLIVKILFNTPTVFTLTVLNNSFIGSLFWVKLFNYAKYYFIPSKSLVSKLYSYNIQKEKIIYCPPGIDTSYFLKDVEKASARKTFGLPQNKFIVVYFGPLFDEKGYKIFLDAAEKLKKNFTDIQFHLFTVWRGSNKENTIYKTIQDKRLSNVQIHMKYVNIHKLISASDIVVLPHKTGNGATIPPISVIEAAISETPLITSSTPGVEDIKSKGNIVLDDISADTLSKQIVYLYKTREQKKLSNRLLIANKFDIINSTKIIYDIYNKVIKTSEN